MNNTWLYLLLFLAMSLTAASGLAQHRYYTRTVRRLAREHDEPGCMLVSGRGKGRVRGAIAVLVLRQARRGDPGGGGHGRRHRPGPLQGAPRLGGPSARDDLPRCSPRLAKAVADARTHVPGRRRPTPVPRARFPGSHPTTKTNS